MYCEDYFGLIGIDFYLLTQPHNKIVNGSGSGLFVITPNLLQKIVATDHLIFVLIQEGKNIEFLV